MRPFLLASLLGLVACGGPSFESLCDRLGDECGLPADEVSECKQYAKLTTDAAEQTDCEGELDDYLSCIDSQEPFCTSTFGASCNADLTALYTCGGVEPVGDD